MAIRYFFQYLDNLIETIKIYSIQVWKNFKSLSKNNSYKMNLLMMIDSYFKNDDDKLIFEIVAENLILELDKVLKLNSNSKSDSKIFVKKKLAMTIFLNDQTDQNLKESTEKEIVCRDKFFDTELSFLINL